MLTKCKINRSGWYRWRIFTAIMLEEMEFVVSARVIRLGQTTDLDFLSFIRQHVEGVEIYEQQFIPGVIYASAKQWKLVGNINALAGILSAALAFYLALKPEVPEERQSQKQPNPQVIVEIENAGHNNTFHIGTDVKSEDDMVKQLRDSLTLLKNQLELQRAKATIDSMRNSPRWKRTQ